MKSLVCLCLSILVLLPLQASELKRVKLHLVGDSTMSDKPNLAYPERGWGQLLPQFLTPQLTIVNHAANGRSTRRFLNEGRWQLLLSELGKGDYVLIQFGHNDSKQSDPARYAAADGDYQRFLQQFITDVRAKGGIPMLASPICRRNFADDGSLKRDLATYANAAAKVASESEVSFFDLQQQSCDFWLQLGKAAAQPYFIQVPPDLYAKFPDGTTDNTHLSVQGASKIAQFFVRDLKAQQHPLAAYVYRELL
ncbi:rhamnogalacturonan acetylesterase [Arsukibacterium indicum]|uniref:Rhamnogalacturonan acetylesterase n=1 Tax=Arsukibacterium indicum TaxID=2848612 RepID=A0ABS6MKY2_9GAMM|nr:rhamnogalacturonan acetylesterase [Arsukibacterium indicum]MBV2129481.1 rhamnogalacturonan acetylesterase [Arsukibacterium indicum]